jgi:hypothetical protein
MGFKAIQLTLLASTPTATIVKGSGATQFLNAFGSNSDPVPVSIKNEDASAVVWWGGPNVDATHGQSIAAGAEVQMNLYGESEVPYVFSTGTPVVSVLLGRQ